MSLTLTNLDSVTRPYMLSEFDNDQTTGKLYMSERLSPSGTIAYPNLMKQAITSQDDSWLASQLQGLFNATETRKKPKGGFTTAKVPVTAPETLAEGEFNRFYARGLCLRAIAEGIENVRVYRAKQVLNPRPQSQSMVGTLLNAKALLSDLRNSRGVEPALGLPPGPNSGLSVELP